MSDLALSVLAIANNKTITSDIEDYVLNIFFEKIKRKNSNQSCLFQTCSNEQKITNIKCWPNYMFCNFMYKIYPMKIPLSKNIYKFHNRLCQAQARCCVKITRHETATEVSHSAVINRKIQNMKFCLYSKYYGRILNIYFFYLIQNSKIFAFQTLNQTHREKVPTTLSFENRAEDLKMEQKI